MLFWLLLVLIFVGLVGGVVVTKFLFFLLVIAALVAAISIFSRRTI